LRREFATVAGYDGLRGRVQIAGARVVAEAGPVRQHVVERRLRERAHRRETPHPALEVRRDRLDARLLQHDLGDPDGVGVARASPCQIAMAGAEPGYQCPTDLEIALHRRGL
jgi:hypothetical protein